MSDSLSALRRSRKMRRVREQTINTQISGNSSRLESVEDDKSSNYTSDNKHNSQIEDLSGTNVEDRDILEGNKLIEALFQGSKKSNLLTSPSSEHKTASSSTKGLLLRRYQHVQSSHDDFDELSETRKPNFFHSIEGSSMESFHRTSITKTSVASKDEKLPDRSNPSFSMARKYESSHEMTREIENEYLLRLTEKVLKKKKGAQNSTRPNATPPKSHISSLESTNHSYEPHSNLQKPNNSQRTSEETENDFLIRLTREKLGFRENSSKQSKKHSKQGINILKTEHDQKLKVRNPITVTSNQQSHFSTINRLEQFQPCNEVFSKNNKMSIEDLWEDLSSEDEATVNPNSPKKTKLQGKKHCTKFLKKPSKVNEATIDVFSSHEEESDEEKIIALEQKLKPDIENPKLGPPSALEPLVLSDVYSVPASINRYLQDYQREGVSFLFSHINQKRGAILGDHMGLGKTVQVIALIAGLLKKNGTGKDLSEMKKRKIHISKKKSAHNDAYNQGLFTGSCKNKGLDPLEFASPWAPILIIVPPSIIDNWSNELENWGHFSFKTFQDDKIGVINSIHSGGTEILVCGKSVFSMESFEDICSIQWKLVVIDEYHEYKNSSTTASSRLEDLKNQTKCPFIGLTGTLMQNKHKELWTLVNFIQPGLLGSWKDFSHHIVKVLKLARTKDAKHDVIALGDKKEKELKAILKQVFLARTKDILKDELTKKTEKILFCALSNVQKQIYRNILALPDYELLCMSNAPCDCGINQKFFSEYKRMRNKKEQSDYIRQNRSNIVKRKTCCYITPRIPGTSRMNPDAVIWRSMHPNDKECKKCPTCILFPCFQKLYDLSSHPSLLQIDPTHKSFDKDSVYNSKTEDLVRFAKVALSKSVLSELPGKSYFRQGGIMDNHMELSGKMKCLDILLNKFRKKRDRVLIFSSSTITLDIIQQYTKSRGFSSLRLDGQTPANKRQGLVDEYQKNDSIFLFLISTKAGGLGLNITAANKVIIYDVSWNPSADEQAQDRAFRIGQKRDVDVIRLVASGTIDELKYMRQIYKVQQKTQATEVGKKSTSQQRIFRGVEGEKHRKGELFGLENLLKFKDDSFVLEHICKTTKIDGKIMNEVYDESDVAGAINYMNKTGIETIFGERSFPESSSHRNKAGRLQANGVESISSTNIDVTTSKRDSTMDHNDFLFGDNDANSSVQDDDDDSIELGAETQMVLDAYDRFDSDIISKQKVKSDDRKQPISKRFEGTNNPELEMACLKDKRKIITKVPYKQKAIRYCEEKLTVKESSTDEIKHQTETPIPTTVNSKSYTLDSQKLVSAPQKMIGNFLLMGMPVKNDPKSGMLDIYIPNYIKDRGHHG